MSWKKGMRASVLAVATLGATVYAAMGSFADDTDRDTSPYSAYTSSELASNWPGSQENPVLVPASLPTASDGADSVRFFFSKTMTLSGRHAGATWVSDYVSDALDPNGTGLFRVYQDMATGKGARQTRCSEYPAAVVRTVGKNRITVCLGATATSAAKRYWRTVQLSDHYTRVAWMKAAGS